MDKFAVYSIGKRRTGYNEFIRRYAGIREKTTIYMYVSQKYVRMKS